MSRELARHILAELATRLASDGHASITFGQEDAGDLRQEVNVWSYSDTAGFTASGTALADEVLAELRSKP